MDNACVGLFMVWLAKKTKLTESCLQFEKTKPNWCYGSANRFVVFEPNWNHFSEPSITIFSELNYDFFGHFHESYHDFPTYIEHFMSYCPNDRNDLYVHKLNCCRGLRMFKWLVLTKIKNSNFFFLRKKKISNVKTIFFIFNCYEDGNSVF